jgi:hypothetical protein
MAVGAIIARILTQYSDKGTKAAIKDVSKMEKRFGDFANKALKAFGLAAAAATAMAVKIGKDAVQAAMEDQKSQALLANQLRNTVGATDAAIASTEEYISKLQLAVGVADDQLRPALAKLAGVTGDLNSAQGLLGVALDLSAGATISLEAATAAVTRAAQGKYGSLEKLGVVIDADTKKSKNFAAVLKILNEQFGGAAAANANTFAGRLARMQLAFGEMYETIGYALLPVLTQLLGYINTQVLPGIQKWVEANKEQLEKSFKNLVIRAVGFFNTMVDLFQFVARNAKVFAQLGAIIVAAMFGAKVAAAVTALIGGITSIIKVYKELRKVSLASAAATALATGGVSAAAGAAAFAAALVGINVAMNKFNKDQDKAGDTLKDLDLSFKGLDVKAKDYLKGLEGITTATGKLTDAQKEEAKVQELLLKLRDKFKLSSKDLASQSPITLEAIRKNQVKQAKLGLSAPSISLLASAGHGNIAKTTNMNGGNVTVNVAGSVITQGDLITAINNGLENYYRRRTGGSGFLAI